MKTCELASGYHIPVIGLGTWTLEGQRCLDAVSMALDMGYTHIDTATAYKNEEVIGKAIVRSGIERKNLFLTTKVWMKNLGHAQVLDSCSASLERLQTEYLDLVLVHWPDKSRPMTETFAAFASLVANGHIRSIGVSNYTIRHCREATTASPVPLSINQVEFHPYLFQHDLLDYCRGAGMVLTAYSPLGRGKVLCDPVVTQIAAYHACSPAQVVISFLAGKGIVVIPKGSSREHLRENLASLSCDLSAHECAQIETLDRGERIINPPWAEFDGNALPS